MRDIHGLHFLALGVLCTLFAAGCGLGGGSSIPNVSKAAALLEVENAFYNSSRMETARYGHTATTLNTGQILVVGGTDERHLTSLDTAEIFEQSVQPDGPEIQSITGVWFDTDFQGDILAMKEGGRIYHTATILSSGNVLIAGGAPDALNGTGYDDQEIYETQSRLFDPEPLQILEEMVHPRFKHTAIVQPNGKILFVGGQSTRDETIIDPNFFPGDPRFMLELTVFPSTNTIEQFNSATLSFEQVFDAAEERSTLSSDRGRHSHAMVRIAGPDKRGATTDDVLLVGGGTSTLTGLFAPTSKFPGSFDSTAVTSLEYWDPVTRSMSVAPNMALERRSNKPLFLNLGALENFTPDGVKGVSNVALLTHGDDDESVQTSVAFSEVLAVTFTGFGATGGITFENVTENGSLYNIEHALVPHFPLCHAFYGISYGDAVMLRVNRTIADVDTISSWVLTCGGVFLFPTPGGQGQSLTNAFCPGTNEVLGMKFFDPYYNHNNLFRIDPMGEPLPPWDLTTTRSDENPTGIVGTWINADLSPGSIPENDYVGWPEIATLAAPNQSPGEGRCFHTLSQLGGFDGQLGTPDDRVLIVGGGDSYFPEYGGEAVSLDTQIYMQPNGNKGLDL